MEPTLWEGRFRWHLSAMNRDWLVPGADGLVARWYNTAMAVIVGVHGIAQQYSGGMELASVWFDALRDGLIAAGYRAKANALMPGDLRVAFFGDLFRPAGAMAAQGPPFTEADLSSGWNGCCSPSCTGRRTRR